MNELDCMTERQRFLYSPRVRDPSGSTSLAIDSASFTAMSTLLGMTHRIIVLGCPMNRASKFLILKQISLGWSSTGVRAIPGRSISVTSGQEELSMRSVISWSLIPFFVPAISFCAEKVKKFAYIANNIRIMCTIYICLMWLDTRNFKLFLKISRL